MLSRSHLDSMYSEIFGTPMPDEIYAYFEHGYYVMVVQEIGTLLGRRDHGEQDTAMSRMSLERQTTTAIREALLGASKEAGNEPGITIRNIQEACNHLPYPWNQFFC